MCELHKLAFVISGVLALADPIHSVRADTMADTLAAARAAYARHDYATELKLLRPIAEAGDARAQTLLGDMYKNGEGVPTDYGKAFGWYQKAAIQGKAQAEADLGTAYFEGAGDPKNYQDYAEAARWWHAAAKQGSAVAQADLGTAYDLGQGVPESDAEAIRWFRMSAEQGDAAAQYNLGIMSEYGVAGPADDVQACVWFSLAAARGDKEAAELRDDLEKAMTPAQVAEVRQQVAAWKPTRAGVP